MIFPTSRIKVAVMGFVAGAVVGAVVTRMIIRRKQAPAQREGSVGSVGSVVEDTKRPLTTEASTFVHEANRIVKRLAEDIDDLIVETRDRLSRQA